MAHLTVSSPRGPNGRGEEASILGDPLFAIVIVRHSQRLPPGCLQGWNEAIVMEKEGHIEPEDQELTTSEDSRVTLLRGVFHKFVS